MEKQFRVLRIIYGASMAGPGFFLIIAFTHGPQNNPVSVLNNIATLICAFIVPISYYIQSIMSKRISPGDEVYRKYSTYQTTKIMQWGFLEGASFINGVAYFLSGSLLNAALAAAMIGFIVLMPPRLVEFKDRFKVSDNDLYGADNL